MHYTNLNGKLVLSDKARALIQHVATTHGTGLLETILMIDGNIQLWTYHCERLANGIVELGLPAIGAETLQDEILRTVTANRLNEVCRIRLQLFGDKQTGSRQYTIECVEIGPELTEYNETGLTIGIANGIYKHLDGLSNLKTTRMGLYNDAKKFAEGHGWDDALVQNDNDHIMESTIANVFWVKEHLLFTPPLSEGCIAGIMRRHLLEELPKYAMLVKERSLTEELLLDADEVFLTNAIRRIKWVKRMGWRTYSNVLSSKISSLLFD